MSTSQYDALAGKLNDPDVGGFTANLRRGGGAPANRYLVGQRDVEEGIHPSPSTGTAIRHYAESNAATLTKPNRQLGGWAFGGSGYLDVPKDYPATPTGHSAARHDAMAQTQIGIGKTGNKGRYKGTEDNPYHEANRYEVQAHDTLEQRSTWANMPAENPPPPKTSRKKLNVKKGTQRGGPSFT